MCRLLNNIVNWPVRCGEVVFRNGQTGVGPHRYKDRLRLVLTQNSERGNGTRRPEPGAPITRRGPHTRAVGAMQNCSATDSRAVGAPQLSPAFHGVPGALARWGGNAGLATANPSSPRGTAQNGLHPPCPLWLISRRCPAALLPCSPPPFTRYSLRAFSDH
jgi:hypothetical protein